MHIKIIDRTKLPYLMRFIYIIFIINLLLAVYSIFDGKLLFGTLILQGIFSKIVGGLLCILWAVILLGISDRKLYALELVVSWMFFQGLLNFSIIIQMVYEMKYPLNEVIHSLIENYHILYGLNSSAELLYAITFLKYVFLLIFNICVIFYFEKNKKLFKF
ncbi:hypothetical protein [Methanococcus maripaludis]|uniref:Uncharacterized protein n=1 Tax=Methanococcus maripaludis TaxID=39152 RepID=A0A2L1C8D0_METMI|nr:hypothetical protein [Methanococcus maripaludis]AVB75632.1 hypothetical protein MMJJ_02130 [Methanococcus maripaludis]MBA2863967.1 hypothetical protein [Methanococcus maripaludis]MBB6496036.1 hypothetical protein [Methanococcus maripaludis]